MALAPQFDLFEDIAITELRDEIAKLKESHRATQKCLFGKNAEVEINVQICRDFMEVFGTSLVRIQNITEILETKIKEISTSLDEVLKRVEKLEGMK